MVTSTNLLIRFLGLYMAIVSVAVLTDKKRLQHIFKIYGTGEIGFLTGIMDTALGLVLVLARKSTWTLSIDGIITLLCWLILLKGLTLLFAQESVTKISDKLRKNKNLTTFSLVIIFLVGLYLSFVGFTS